MSNLRIAIDGACRRNGKPDCVSAGGVLVCTYEDGKCIASRTLYDTEYASTSQRGEMLALKCALSYIIDTQQDAQIVTDSEHLFNTMSKQWWQRWYNNGWKTATGSDVKNADIWKDIAEIVMNCTTEVNYYHIKGHCISFGQITARNLLEEDKTGILLGRAVTRKYNESLQHRATELEAAQSLSEKNNGFRLAPDELRKFVVMNTVADAIATVAVEYADSVSSSIMHAVDEYL